MEQKECEKIIECVKKSSVFVGGDINDFPIKCCILDVKSKVDGRFLMKDLSFFEDHFILSVDGVFIDVDSCGISSQLGYRKHHQILDFVKGLRACQGVRSSHDNLVDKLHEEGTKPPTRTKHAVNCNIVISNDNRWVHCNHCDAFSTEG